jgi:hypothetical protein
MAEHARSEVKRLEALAASTDWTDDQGARYGRAALEHGQRLTMMQADRAKWLVDAVDAQRSK